MTPMSKLSRLILATVLFAGVAAVSSLPRAEAAPARGAARPGARALLVNPDFEKGIGTHPWMPAGWDTSMADLPTVFFGRASFLVHSGHWAVSLANMSSAFPMGHNWSQTLLVGPEVWGKTAS